MNGSLFWQQCLTQFAEELTPQQFNTWIRPLSLEGSSEGLQLLAPNRFHMQWIRDRFLHRVEEAAKHSFGFPVPVSLGIQDPVDAPLPAPTNTPDDPVERTTPPLGHLPQPPPCSPGTGPAQPSFHFRKFCHWQSQPVGPRRRLTGCRKPRAGL